MAKTAAFRLHPSLDPEKYRITDSLADARDWRAHCYSANSGGTVGAMEEVGYVMVSRTDDTIVPMARGDEHHQGYDTLFDLARKHKALKTRDYVAVWPHGNNYVYDRSDIPILLDVIGKFLSYGGEDGILIGCNDLTGKIVTLTSFVESKGSIELAPGTVGPLGAQVLAAFQALADALGEARGQPKTQAELAEALAPVRGSAAARKAKAAERAALALVKLLTRYAGHVRGLEYEEYERMPKEVRRLAKSGDLQGLDALFFGMSGVKNRIHGAVRQAIAGKSAGKPNWEDVDTIAVWGDLALANDMLGRF